MGKWANTGAFFLFLFSAKYNLWISVGFAVNKATRQFFSGNFMDE